MLDLERCSFARPLDSATDTGEGSGQSLGCFSDREPREISASEQRDVCLTPRHCSCPRLLAALGSRPDDAWADIGQAMRVVAESCYLAEALLEVQSERLGPAVARIFGPT